MSFVSKDGIDGVRALYKWERGEIKSNVLQLFEGDTVLEALFLPAGLVSSAFVRDGIWPITDGHSKR